MSRLFDRIAPIYDLFYGYQKRSFSLSLSKIWNELELSTHDSLIDVGSGTGSLSAVFRDWGLQVTGVDASPGMVRRSKGRRDHQDIHFLLADARGKLPFAAKSFDIAFCGFVAHGMKAPERRRLYLEMKRLARHRVIIYDYNANRNPLISLVEWAEGGDYFNFIKVAKPELKRIFASVRVIGQGSHSAWYICDPS